MSKDNEFEHLATVISTSCERHGIDLREPEKDLLAIDVLGAIFGANQKQWEDGYRRGFTDGYVKGLCDGGRGVIDQQIIDYGNKKAVIEFAEKLKGKLQDFGDGGEKGAYITEKDIDEFIKEVEKQ
nr:MAG TPA: hypothetical protein [Caudoviricetes sp.]